MAGRRSRQRAAGLHRQPERRRQGRDRRRRQEGRSGLQLSLPEPRADGADERHGALYAGQMRGLVRYAERRSGLCRRAGSVGVAGRKVRGTQAHPRRWLWPARHDRLRPAGSSHRQADAGHTRQAAVVARRGHGARQVSSGHAMQNDRGLRCRQQSHGAARQIVRSIDPVHGASGGASERHGYGRVPGPQSFRRRGDRLLRAEPAGRAFHAQSPRPARLLARREREPERDLYGMLHG